MKRDIKLSNEGDQKFQNVSSGILLDVLKIYCEFFSKEAKKNVPFIKLQLGNQVFVTPFMEGLETEFIFDSLHYKFQIESEMIEFDQLLVQVYESRKDISTDIFIGYAKIPLESILFDIGAEFEIPVNIIDDIGNPLAYILLLCKFSEDDSVLPKPRYEDSFKQHDKSSKDPYNPVSYIKQGDTVLITNAEDLQLILNIFSPNLDSISPLHIIDIADQYATVMALQLDNPSELEDIGDFAILMLESGHDIALPFSAFSPVKMEISEVDDDDGDNRNASQYFRSNTHSFQDDLSYLRRNSQSNFSEDIILIQNMAAECIQEAFRRHRAYREGLKERRRLSTDKLVLNLAAETIVNNLRRVVTKKRSNQELEKLRISRSGSLNTVEMSSLMRQNSGLIESSDRIKAYENVLEISDVEIFNIPSLAWNEKRNLYVLIDIKNFCFRTNTNQNAKWSGVITSAPLPDTDIYSDGSKILFTVSVFHQRIGQEDKFIGFHELTMESLREYEDVARGSGIVLPLYDCYDLVSRTMKGKISLHYKFCKGFRSASNWSPRVAESSSVANDKSETHEIQSVNSNFIDTTQSITDVNGVTPRKVAAAIDILNQWEASSNSFNGRDNIYYDESRSAVSQSPRDDTVSYLEPPEIDISDVPPREKIEPVPTLLPPKASRKVADERRSSNGSNKLSALMRLPPPKSASHENGSRRTSLTPSNASSIHDISSKVVFQDSKVERESHPAIRASKSAKKVAQAISDAMILKLFPVVQNVFDQAFRIALLQICATFQLTLRELCILLDSLGYEVNEAYMDGPSFDNDDAVSLSLPINQPLAFAAKISEHLQEHVYILKSSEDFIFTAKQAFEAIKNILRLIKGSYTEIRSACFGVCGENNQNLKDRIANTSTSGRGKEKNPNSYSEGLRLSKLSNSKIKPLLLEMKLGNERLQYLDGSELLTISPQEAFAKFAIRSSVLQARFLVYQKTFQILDSYWDRGLRPQDSVQVIEVGDNLPKGKRTESSNHTERANLEKQIMIGDAYKLFNTYVPMNRAYGWGYNLSDLSAIANTIGGFVGLLANSLPREDSLDAASVVPQSDDLDMVLVRVAFPTDAIREHSLHVIKKLKPMKSILFINDSDSELFVKLPSSCFVPVDVDLPENATLAYRKRIPSGQIALGMKVRVVEEMALTRLCQKYEWWDRPSDETIARLSNKTVEIISLAELDSKDRVGVRLAGYQLCDAVPVEAISLLPHSEAKKEETKKRKKSKKPTHSKKKQQTEKMSDDEDIKVEDIDEDGVEAAAAHQVKAIKSSKQTANLGKKKAAISTKVAKERDLESLTNLSEDDNYKPRAQTETETETEAEAETEEVDIVPRMKVVGTYKESAKPGAVLKQVIDYSWLKGTDKALEERAKKEAAALAEEEALRKSAEMVSKSALQAIKQRLLFQDEELEYTQGVYVYKNAKEESPSNSPKHKVEAVAPPPGILREAHIGVIPPPPSTMRPRPTSAPSHRNNIARKNNSPTQKDEQAETVLSSNAIGLSGRGYTCEGTLKPPILDFPGLIEAIPEAKEKPDKSPKKNKKKGAQPNLQDLFGMNERKAKEDDVSPEEFGIKVVASNGLYPSQSDRAKTSPVRPKTAGISSKTKPLSAIVSSEIDLDTAQAERTSAYINREAIRTAKEAKYKEDHILKELKKLEANSKPK